MACEILVLQSLIQLEASAVGAWSLNLWTAREVPRENLLKMQIFLRVLKDFQIFTYCCELFNQIASLLPHPHK